MRHEVVECPDCGADLDCWDGDLNTLLEVHASQDCEGVR